MWYGQISVWVHRFHSRSALTLPGSFCLEVHNVQHIMLHSLKCVLFGSLYILCTACTMTHCHTQLGHMQCFCDDLCPEPAEQGGHDFRARSEASAQTDMGQPYLPQWAAAHQEVRKAVNSAV